ncbi:MAG: hypothetical protein ACK4SQ_14170 [Allorhizobium sp.]
MTAILAAVLRILGPAGIAAVVVYFYYEGAPIVNRLPYVDQVPIIRELGVGRVELERREAVKGLVTQAEMDALAAVLDQERAKASAAAAMATEARNRADALLRLKQTQQAEIDRLMEEATKTPGLTYPTPEDLQWHGSR